MKVRVPLAVKLVVPLVFLVILAVGLTGFRVYQRIQQRWQQEMDTRLQRVATLVANTVDPALLQSINEPAHIDGLAYLTVQRQLEQALTAGNLAWVGIYYQEDDYFYYWVDYDFSGVGYPFFYPSPGHVAAYQDRQVHRVEYTDEFGSYYGFVAPILAAGENGGQDGQQVIGLVEASVTVEARDLLRREAFDSVLPILFGVSFISILILIIISIILVNRPLRRLQQGALVLAGGRFGHTIHLHSRDELEDLAGTFNQMSEQLERLYQERAHSERVQRELEIARSVQQALFPETPGIPGLQIAAVCQPHRETSGDFYDLLALENSQLGIVVGDVSGKSIPAAMLMVAAHSIIRSEANDHDTPARVLDEANLLLCANVPRGMFVAANYACLDTQSRRLVWANAGQMYPFMLHRVRPADPAEYPRYLESTGTSLPLGVDATAIYSNQHLQLYPGDTVLFYTDGVIEAMNPGRELYGFERLEALFRSLEIDLSAQALIEAVLADMARFVGPAEQHDDITMVAVKLTDGIV